MKIFKKFFRGFFLGFFLKKNIKKNTKNFNFDKKQDMNMYKAKTTWGIKEKLSFFGWKSPSQRVLSCDGFMPGVPYSQLKEAAEGIKGKLSLPEEEENPWDLSPFMSEDDSVTPSDISLDINLEDAKPIPVFSIAKSWRRMHT